MLRAEIVRKYSIIQFYKIILQDEREKSLKHSGNIILGDKMSWYEGKIQGNTISEDKT